MNTRDDDRGLVVGNDSMVVLQHLDAEFFEMCDPCRRIPKIFVIAGDEKGSVAGTEISQGLDPITKFIDIPIDQITGDRNEVGVLLIDPVDHSPNVVSSAGWADVKIGDLHDAKAVGRRRKRSDGYIDLDHFGEGTRFVVANTGT